MRFFFQILFPLIVFIFCLKFLTVYNWRESVDLILKLHPGVVLKIIFLVILNYVLLSLFDIFTIKKLNSKISILKIGLISFISYSFSMNLGPLLGSFGMRLKLYKEVGLSTKMISKVIVQGTQSNWIGFCLVGSLLMIFIGRWGGWLGLIGVFSYGILVKKIPLTFWKKFHLEKNFFDINLLLIGVASVHWLNQVYILYLITKIQYLILLKAQLISALTSLASHIPSGLAIYEITMKKIIPNEKFLLGGILVYRFFLYFLPFILSIPLYVFRFKLFRRVLSGFVVTKNH